jgi:hypothetical protein
MERSFFAAVAFEVSFLLALCTAGPVHATAPTDACSLLTPAQVSAVLGITVKPGHSVPGDATVCDWPLASLAKMMARDTKEVEVKILDAQSWALITPAANAAAPLKGVGDYAVYLGDADLVSLYVKKGQTRFSVNVHGFPLDQIKAKEKTLAQEIVTTL